MIHPHTTQALLIAFRMASELTSQKQQRQHVEAIAELRVGVLKDMVDALVTRRVDVIRTQCATILNMYADQARHYMSIQMLVTQKLLDTTDALQRANLVAQSNDCDSQLGKIRADALAIFERMGELIIALGGRDLNFARDISAPLSLPA